MANLFIYLFIHLVLYPILKMLFLGSDLWNNSLNHFTAALHKLIPFIAKGLAYQFSWFLQLSLVYPILNQVRAAAKISTGGVENSYSQVYTMSYHVRVIWLNFSLSGFISTHLWLGENKLACSWTISPYHTLTHVISIIYIGRTAHSNSNLCNTSSEMLSVTHLLVSHSAVRQNILCHIVRNRTQTLTGYLHHTHIPHHIL